MGVSGEPDEIVSGNVIDFEPSEQPGAKSSRIL
jgi:hypothetical protein